MSLNIKQTLTKVLKNTLMVQVIGLVLVPLLYINYQSSDFSEYGTFVSISTILGVFIGLRLENLFFSLKNYKDLFLFSIFGVFSIFLLIFIFVSVFLNNGTYVLSVFCGMTIALFNSCYNYLVRSGEDNFYVKLKLYRAILELIFVIISVFFKLKIFYLFIFVSISYLVPSLFVLFIKMQITGLVEGYKIFLDNFKYIVSDFISTLLNNIYIYVPTIYFNYYDKVDQSSNYFLVLKILGTPIIMIAQSISTVIRQYASNEFSTNYNIFETYKFFKNKAKISFVVLFVLFVLTLVFFYLLSFYIDGIFIYSIPLIFLFYVRGMYNSLSSLVYVFKLQSRNLIFQFFLLLSACLGLIIDVDTVFYYSIFSILVYVFFMVDIFYYISRKGYID